MNRKHQTYGYSVGDYVDALEAYIAPDFFYWNRPEYPTVCREDEWAG